MPTFSGPRPSGIAQSFAAMLSGNSGLSAKDILDVETKLSGVERNRAATAHGNSLAEKVRQEAEIMREQQQQRTDPNAQIEYGARSSGMQLPDAQQLEQNFRGAQLQPLTPNDDEGNAMPPAAVQAPANVTPQQTSLYRAATAAMMANRMATGKTNANQLTQAGGNLLTDSMRANLTRSDITPSERTGTLEAVSEKPVMPYRQNGAGTSVLNEMTGTAATPGTVTATAGNALTDARSVAERALAGLRGKQGTLADARADNVRQGGRGFKPVDPVQAEKRISDLTTKEYDSLPRDQRKAMTLEQYRNKRRAEISHAAASAGGSIDSEINDARKAISNGADAAQVKARFRQRTKADLPDDDEE